MNRPTQGTLLALTGALCLRLGMSGEYLLYVNAWMRWPLVGTGAVLIALGLRLIWTDPGFGSGTGPASAWLLALPTLAVFVINPPALGAFAADRVSVGTVAEKDYARIQKAPVVAMAVSEYLGRAQWDDSLTGYRVALTGFVTHGSEGTWSVTSLAMSCCAADAVAYKVRVDRPDQDRPEENTWVRVIGTWARPPGDDLPRPGPAIIDAVEVAPAEAPDSPFE